MEASTDTLFWTYVLPVLGLLMLYKCVVSLWRFLFSVYLVKELDLPQRYGKGSWAVVTGCTEGIGLEFCSSLARRGFNLVMVARNLDKIEARARHIVENNRNIMYKSIVADCDKDGADPE